ncbi:MAG: Glutamate synthase large chain [Myxococcales bacterium]|nr:Glutamate synthase large chain [Myxococcales bacterium]
MSNRVWFRLALVTSLGACGNDSSNVAGDGGVSNDPDAGDASGPDTTAPALVSITPTPGASTWLHEPIRLVFNEPLDPASLANAVVTANVAGTVVTAQLALENPRTIAVTIDPAARGMGSLAVHVSGPIADPAGNVTTAPIDVQLTLPAWSRLAVDRGVAASSPVLAVAASGVVYAAWMVGAAGSRHVAVSMLDRGAWRDLGGELGASDATSPAIALDASGRPVVAWSEAGQAQVARWDGSWTSLPSPGAATFVALASPSGGDPIAAMFGTTVAVRMLVNNGWQPLGGDLAIPGAIAGEPALAVPAAGRATVGWIDTTGGVPRLRVYRYDSSWTAISPIVLGAPPSGFDRMSLAARDQTIAVAWDQWAGSFGVLAAMVSGTATTWTRLGHTLDVDVQGDALAPAVAIDVSGAPIVAWTELVEGKYRGIVAKWASAKWNVVGGVTFLATAEAAPARAQLALHVGQAPVVGFSANGVSVARFNGPATAAFGIDQRTSIAGCTISATAPPQHLAQTGCFTIAIAGRPTPHAGLVPYDIVNELWTDGAKKRRWIALPDGGSMTTSATGAWNPPNGTIIIKEFALEITPGDHTTRRAIETRFLVKDAQLGWQGFSYKWRVDGTDADLQTDGEERYDWQLSNGTWHTHIYPSRSECLSCHENSYGPMLGLRPEQLQRWNDYNGVIAEQLPTLAHLGVGPASPNAVPFISPHDPSETAEHRMRGYMAANCAHCHNPDHIAIKDFRYTTPLSQTRLCEVVVPGSPSQSRVYQLVSSRPGMPALGSAYVDPLAVSMLGTWITGMTSCP